MANLASTLAVKTLKSGNAITKIPVLLLKYLIDNFLQSSYTPPHLIQTSQIINNYSIFFIKFKVLHLIVNNKYPNHLAV